MIALVLLNFSVNALEGMADFQFMPDMNDPVAKLRSAMDRMDGKFLRVVLTASFPAYTDLS